MRYNRCMEVEWKDFVKRAQSKKPATKPAPIVKGTIHRVAPPPTAAANPSPQPSVAGLRRVGGSPGASSTGWDPNYKPPKPRWGVSYRCDQCGQEYGKPNPKWTAGEKASWKKEIEVMIARDKRFHDLRKKYKGAPIPVEELRKAFNGS